MSYKGKCKSINHDFTGKLNADGYCEWCESLMQPKAVRELHVDKPVCEGCEFHQMMHMPGYTKCTAYGNPYSSRCNQWEIVTLLKPKQEEEQS